MSSQRLAEKRRSRRGRRAEHFRAERLRLHHGRRSKGGGDDPVAAREAADGARARAGDASARETRAVRALRVRPRLHDPRGDVVGDAQSLGGDPHRHLHRRDVSDHEFHRGVLAHLAVVAEIQANRVADRRRLLGGERVAAREPRARTDAPEDVVLDA